MTALIALAGWLEENVTPAWVCENHGVVWANAIRSFARWRPECWRYDNPSAHEERIETRKRHHQETINNVLDAIEKLGSRGVTTIVAR